MNDELMWVEKYRPKRIAEIVGNEEAKASFVDWLKSNRWRKKATLLYGPPGVGKSALVHATANEFNFKIIEMNARSPLLTGIATKCGINIPWIMYRHKLYGEIPRIRKQEDTLLQCICVHAP